MNGQHPRPRPDRTPQKTATRPTKRTALIEAVRQHGNVVIAAKTVGLNPYAVLTARLHDSPLDNELRAAREHYAATVLLALNDPA